MPQRIGLRWADWPPQDRVAWAAAFDEAGGPLDESGPAAEWRPKTIDDARYEYGRWLTFITQHDSGALLLMPAARVSEATIRAYVVTLHARVSAMSVAAALHHLVLALRAMCPGDWSWLRRIQQKIANKARPRDKRARMVSGHRLYALGWQLMRDADQAPTKGERFRSYRDGLLIALLCSRPLRRSNIAGLRLGQNVTMTSSAVRLHFTANEMKNGRPHEIWLPDDLLAPMLRYVRDVRASLPQAGGHDALWCSSNGRGLTPDAMYHVILRRTHAAFDQLINMHLFRDIAAATLALDVPAEARLARDLLGHARLDTTERHYLRGQTSLAGSQYIHLTEILRSAQN